MKKCDLIVRIIFYAVHNTSGVPTFTSHAKTAAALYKVSALRIPNYTVCFITWKFSFSNSDPWSLRSLIEDDELAPSVYIHTLALSTYRMNPLHTSFHFAGKILWGFCSVPLPPPSCCMSFEACTEIFMLSLESLRWCHQISAAEFMNAL